MRDLQEMKQEKKDINKSERQRTGIVLKMTVLVTLILFGVGFTCCHKDNVEEEDNLKITGVSIPSSLDVVIHGDIILTGKGFEVDDVIRFVLASDNSNEYTSSVTSVTATTVTFPLPDGIFSGVYSITVERGEESLSLGSVTINVLADLDIPDINGMTVKGVVYCDGQGISGVTVSDGIEVTTTDANGIYYLPSQKKYGYVFISVPGNYEVANSNNIPQFFKRLAGGGGVEQKDFSLFSVDNSKHVVLTMADWHLANRNDDLAQLSSGFITDINSVISTYKAAGTKVYGLTLGDMSWDLYWYSNNFDLSDYLPQMVKVNCPVFNMMGNHDNDPYIQGDFAAETNYRDLIGPTYYSFNLGNVHYVILDATQYINTGASQGVVGDRNYNEIIIADQMAWLNKDLATISDKTKPLIIALHPQLYTNPTLDINGQQVSSFHLSNGSSLVTAVSGFSNVHVLSGHTHVNFSVAASASLMEHNTAAVSATWWWTGKSGYAGNHVCTDGSPGGYGIWEIDGNTVEWYYKGSGLERNRQFRTYDLNEVYITAAEFAPNSTDEALSGYVGPYGTQSLNNEVLINVWGYDPQWTISVKEGGVPLVVERVSALDPLHIISYEAKRLNAGSVPTSSFTTNLTAHMFKVTALSATSTLEIKVTDRFGNIYSETMVRPKNFTYSMK
jgi:hypothetical protein